MRSMRSPPQRVDVVAAEVELGIAAAFFGGAAVPEFAAVGVEEDAVAEVGAAMPKWMTASTRWRREAPKSLAA
jgi:hypothetical protein